MAKNNKTRFFYVLYSDKTRVFDQSERAYYPVYIINIYIYIYIYIYKYFKRKKDATTFSRQACFVNRFTLQGFNGRIFM